MEEDERTRSALRPILTALQRVIADRANTQGSRADVVPNHLSQPQSSLVAVGGNITGQNLAVRRPTCCPAQGEPVA